MMAWTRPGLHDGQDAGKDLGEADEDIRGAKNDYYDEDQDAQDKAHNMTEGGADALDNVGEALEDLGIDDPGFGDLADAIRALVTKPAIPPCHPCEGGGDGGRWPFR